ncbi:MULTISPECIES: phage antirepressor KilAC domain-containing protein [unclassified Bacteroides]|uniref:phage antirepressor KilAC domain-containing protein n=1 Tax=unclassified Bacteroides TaxID=2646097 RepID=UPI004063A5D6
MTDLMIKDVAQTMSSREIAQLTGKEHRNVLRDCETLNESYEKLGLLKIEQGYYTHPNTGNQQHREFLLTKMQTFDLLTGYNAELRIKVNRRWEELERQTQVATKALPQNYKEALLALVKEVEEKEALQAQVEAAKPAVVFTTTVQGAKTSILVGELAKLITQSGRPIGQNRLFKWLRDNGYLGKKGSNYNVPMQKYVEMGLFEIKEGTRSGNDGVMHITKTPKVTGKGQVYFVNKFVA